MLLIQIGIVYGVPIGELRSCDCSDVAWSLLLRLSVSWLAFLPAISRPAELSACGKHNCQKASPASSRVDLKKGPASECGSRPFLRPISDPTSEIQSTSTKRSVGGYSKRFCNRHLSSNVIPTLHPHTISAPEKNWRH